MRWLAIPFQTVRWEQERGAIFSPSVGSRGAAQSRGQRHQQHPPLGGFDPLRIKPSCCHTLLVHMDIHICNRDHTWETTGVPSWNVFIPSGFIARVFPMNHPHFTLSSWCISCIGTTRDTLSFSLTENKYQKVVYLSPNVVFLPLFNYIF